MAVIALLSHKTVKYEPNHLQKLNLLVHIGKIKKRCWQIHVLLPIMFFSFPYICAAYHFTSQF